MQVKIFLSLWEVFASTVIIDFWLKDYCYNQNLILLWIYKSFVVSILLWIRLLTILLQGTPLTFKIIGEVPRITSNHRNSACHVLRTQQCIFRTMEIKNAIAAKKNKMRNRSFVELCRFISRTSQHSSVVTLAENSLVAVSLNVNVQYCSSETMPFPPMLNHGGFPLAPSWQSYLYMRSGIA